MPVGLWVADPRRTNPVRGLAVGTFHLEHKDDGVEKHQSHQADRQLLWPNISKCTAAAYYQSSIVPARHRNVALRTAFYDESEAAGENDLAP